MHSLFNQYFVTTCCSSGHAISVKTTISCLILTVVYTMTKKTTLFFLFLCWIVKYILFLFQYYNNALIIYNDARIEDSQEYLQGVMKEWKDQARMDTNETAIYGSYLSKFC